jgi:hypothetical protein
LNLIGNIKSWLAETASFSLGHGAVATDPDRPYLTWQFNYEHPAMPSGERNNPETFLEACKELHEMFRQAAALYPTLGGGTGLPFATIEGAVKEVLAFQGKGEDRAARWGTYAAQGKFGQAFIIPAFEGVEWNLAIRNLHDTDDSSVALSSHACNFFKAASAHRQYVLRDLLPQHGLVVA